MESRANSLRAYAENLLESDNTTLADEEISGLVDDLIEFAEQWEAELNNAKQPDSAAPKQIELSDIVSIPCTHCGNKVNFAQPKPQRITEQDAREIIAGYQQFHPANYIAEFLDDWIGNHNFKALLAKLNEHRELDYKALCNDLVNTAKEFMDYVNETVHLDDTKKLTALYEAIAKASASTDNETDAAGILIRPQVKVE